MLLEMMILNGYQLFFINLISIHYDEGYDCYN
jgi:hypothetical protein